jgi:hypothetical protein
MKETKQLTKKLVNAIVTKKRPYSQDSGRKYCNECGAEFRYNLVCDRRTDFKYLRSGCCDLALRKCPDPEILMRSPNLSSEERDYLRRVACLSWFSGQVAAVLLQLEAKTQAGAVIA